MEDDTDEPEEQEYNANEQSTDIMYGDVNSDGLIDATDASDILQFYAYTSTGGTASLSEFLRMR